MFHKKGVRIGIRVREYQSKSWGEKSREVERGGPLNLLCELRRLVPSVKRGGEGAEVGVSG